MARPKNTLFCPRCGHASPTDGDWRVRASPSGAVYRCPDCGADVTTRPREEARPRAPAERPCGVDLLATWVRIVRAWTAVPLSGRRPDSSR